MTEDEVKTAIHPSVYSRIVDTHKFEIENRFSVLRTNIGSAGVVLCLICILSFFSFNTFIIGITFSLAFAYIIHTMTTVKSKRQKIDLPYIQSIQNRLFLSKNQNHYLNYICTLFSVQNIDKEAKKEWTDSLWKIIEISNRLEIISNSNRKDITAAQAAIPKEMLSMTKLIEESNDETTKDIYLQGIEILKRRMAKTELLAKYVSRTEAHLSLIELTLTESVYSIKTASAQSFTTELAQLDSNLLRENLLTLQNNSDEVLRAMEELASN